jgi:hypothetical protein
MQNIGRHKIYQTNWILYNQIDPNVDEIKSMMGTSGLLGDSWGASKTDTTGAGWSNSLTYVKEGMGGKTFSYWVNLDGMASGDTITIAVKYREPWDNTYDVFKYYNCSGVQTIPYKLIVDKMPILYNVTINQNQTMGNPFTIKWHCIMEEN